MEIIIVLTFQIIKHGKRERMHAKCLEICLIYIKYSGNVMIISVGNGESDLSEGLLGNRTSFNI